MKKLTGIFDWYTSWGWICEKSNGKRFSVGDTCELDPMLRKADYYTTKTMRVNSVIIPKWENMPCSQYLDVDGLPFLILNTMLK